MEIHNIFNSQIWKTKLNYSNKDKLIKKIERKYKIQPNLKPIHWRCNLHTSFTYVDGENFILDEHSELLRCIQTKINLFEHLYNSQTNLKTDLILSNIWYNAYLKDQFQEPHNHDGAIFSGCYYLKFNKKKHYQTQFYNPNYKVNHSKIEDNSYFCFTPNCEEDDLIIFPSKLEHATKGVKKNCDEIRITVSFNIKNKSEYTLKSKYSKILYL